MRTICTSTESGPLERAGLKGLCREWGAIEEDWGLGSMLNSRLLQRSAKRTDYIYGENKAKMKGDCRTRRPKVQSHEAATW
jgi:hypothetical protein